MRHKFLAKLEQDWYPNTTSSKSIFDEMKEAGLVADEYEYSTKDTWAGGKVFIVSKNGEKFMAIATNSCRTYTSNSWGRRRRSVYRIMYRLSEEGARYIREQLVEQEI